MAEFKTRKFYVMAAVLIQKEIRTALGVYKKRADGILVFEINPSVKKIDIEALSEQLNIFLELQYGVPSPFIMISHEMNSLGAAEKKFIKETVSMFATSVAMVTQSPITNFIINLFIYLYQPPLPARLFDDEEKAIAWSKKQSE
jgi:hypothetical protein